MPPARPLTVETLWSLRRLGRPTVNADGSVLVAPITTYSMESNAATTQLWRCFLDGRAPVALTSTEDVSSQEPALSPEGSRVAFVRKPKDGTGQLALLDLSGGDAEVLTDAPLGVTDPQWFPDGKRIAFLAPVYADALTWEAARKRKEERDKDPVKAHVTEDRLFRFWDTWLTDGKVHHIYVMDLETRKITDLTPDSTRWFEFMDPKGSYDISPDGKEIAFSANASAPPHSPTNWDVFLVSTSGGPARNITQDNPADDVLPRYSPDGKTLLYGLKRSQTFYADRIRLVAYDRAKGTHTVLTEQWDRSAGEWAFAADGSVFLLAEHEGRSALFHTTLEVRDPRHVVSGGSFSGVHPLADGSVLTLRNTLSMPDDLVRIAPDGKLKQLTRVNADRMEDVALGKTDEITFKGSDGRDIQAYVVYPPEFDPQKQWPLVAVLHGGPHGITTDGFHYRWNLQLMAAPGYVVVAPNFHGSTSWGQDFAQCIQGAWGDKPYTDSMAAVDHMLSLGFIDAKRMAAAGGSYGGYLVSWIAGRTDRFAAIINHAGVADLFSSYASDVTYGRAKSMGGEAWDGIERIDAMNPMRLAEGFVTPMLVVHGEKDYRVPVTQGLAIYNVYKAKGVPARLVYYPDENHWVLKPRNAQLWYREFFAWLERWL